MHNSRNNSFSNSLFMPMVGGIESGDTAGLLHHMAFICSSSVWKKEQRVRRSDEPGRVVSTDRLASVIEAYDKHLHVRLVEEIVPEAHQEREHVPRLASPVFILSHSLSRNNFAAENQFLIDAIPHTEDWQRPSRPRDFSAKAEWMLELFMVMKERDEMAIHGQPQERD